MMNRRNNYTSKSADGFRPTVFVLKGREVVVLLFFGLREDLCYA